MEDRNIMFAIVHDWNWLITDSAQGRWYSIFFPMKIPTPPMNVSDWQVSCVHPKTHISSLPWSSIRVHEILQWVYVPSLPWTYTHTVMLSKILTSTSNMHSSLTENVLFTSAWVVFANIHSAVSGTYCLCQKSIFVILLQWGKNATMGLQVSAINGQGSQIVLPTTYGITLTSNLNP